MDPIMPNQAQPWPQPQPIIPCGPITLITPSTYIVTLHLNRKVFSDKNYC